MATYYVDNTVAGPGTGTKVDPFKEIATAATQSNNNTVKVLYTGTDYDTSNQTFPISPYPGTTITRWEAADGGSDTNPIIKADAWVSDFILLTYGSNLGIIKIEYLDFDGGDYVNANQIHKWPGTQFDSLEIANCRFTNIRSEGILVEFNSSDTGSRVINIHDNYFEPFYTTLTSTIYTWSTTVPVTSTSGFGASGNAGVIGGAYDEDDFAYTGKTGTTFTGVTGISVTHYAGEIVYPLGIATPQGIYIRSATQGDGNAYGVDLAGSQVKSNIFANFKHKWATGLRVSDVDGGGTGVTNGFIIDSNEFRNNWWGLPLGIWAYGWTGAEAKGCWTIVNNLIYGGGSGHGQQVGMWLEPWSNAEGKFYVLNNDVYGKTGGIYLFRALSGHQVWNNVFWNSSSYDIYIHAYQGWGLPAVSLNQIKRNQFNSGPGTGHWIVKEWGTYPLFNAILYSDAEVSAVTVQNAFTDPQYKDAANNNYRKDFGSPCLDTGLDTSFNYDIEGNTRPGGSFDRGAYEKTLVTDTILESEISIESLVQTTVLASEIELVIVFTTTILQSQIAIYGPSAILLSEITLEASINTTTLISQISLVFDSSANPLVLASQIAIGNTSIVITNCSNATIQNCIIKSSSRYGIEIDSSCNNTLIVNNTFAGAYDDAAIKYDANNTTIQNTIVSISSTSYGIVKESSPTGEKVDHNDVYGASSFAYYDLTAATSYTPSPGTGNLAVDPRFMDPINENYMLRADSPCIDAGSSENAPGTDIMGAVRPQ
jgi:parallel beta-helix repeat protein